jgi:hypothetical protein
MRAFAKTNFTVLAMLFAMALVLAGVSMLAQTSPSTQPVQGQTLSGNVVSVDSPGKMIKIKDDQGNEHMIYVNSSTKLQSVEKSLDLNDVKAGDHIVASVKSDSGQMVALSITVHKKEPSSTSSATSTGSTTGTAYDTKSDNRQSDIATTETTDKEKKTSEVVREPSTSTTTTTTSSSTESTTGTATRTDERRSDIAAKETTGREQRISGKIASIDPANNSLVLRDDQGQSHTIKIDSSTTFMSDSGASINNLSDLKSGDRVVAVMKGDDRTLAMSLRKTSEETAMTGTTTRTPSPSYETSQTATSTERLPRTATPLPLVGMIGLLLLSAGVVVRKIVG